MKKLVTSAFLLALFATCFGQSMGVKLALPGLSYGNIGLSYEYGVSKKTSIQAHVSFLLPKTSFSAMQTAITDQNYTLAEDNIGGFGAHFDYRIFTGDKAMDGFYFGPWIRYYRYAWKVNYNSIDDETTPTINESYNYDGKLGLGAASLGFGIGYQWMINETIAIDWGFLGLGATMGSIFGKLETNDPAFTTDDITQTFGDIPLIGSRFKAENDGTQKFKVSAPWAGIAWRSQFKIGFYF